MGLVVFRHGQDRDEGDGALLADAAAGTLIERGKVGIEVAGVAAAARDLLARGGDLTQSLGVVRDVGHDDQHVHPALEGQIFGGGQGHTRRCDTLDSRVVGEVREDDGAVDGARAAEFLDEELRFLERDADGGEDDGEVRRVVAQHLRLTGDLGGQLRMRQAGAGEDRQLLAADEGVEPVDRGDACLDEFVGVVAGSGVHGQAVDVLHLGRQDLGAAVLRVAHAVEDAAEHILGHGQLQRVAQEADLAVLQVDASGVFKQLDDGGIAVALEDLAVPDLAVRKLELCQLVVGDALDVFDDHQRPGDLTDGTIFPDHSASASFATSSICCSMSASICA